MGYDSNFSPIARLEIDPSPWFQELGELTQYGPIVRQVFHYTQDRDRVVSFRRLVLQEVLQADLTGELEPRDQVARRTRWTSGKSSATSHESLPARYSVSVPSQLATSSRR